MTRTQSIPSDSDVLRGLADETGRPAASLVPVDCAEPGVVECTIAWPAHAPLVVDVVQIFESLGVRVARHSPSSGVERYLLLGWPGSVADTEELFRDALAAIDAGAAERDSLNRLVLGARMTWRQVLFVRALCRYLRQTSLGLGLEYVEHTVVRNGSVARALVALFEARFDPDQPSPSAEIDADARLEELLDGVATLDEDRVLRALAEIVRATMRTSYFQRDTAGAPLPRLTLKIEPGPLAFVPDPKPLVETYVYSPVAEGLHLRTARVARGGLRWSERPEDFRSEVLGLMKAQAVKNSVIVPAGAKGAFVIRTELPDEDRDAARRLVIEGYAIFVRGLLDVTDNLVNGVEQPPARVRRHDSSDTYLVVAADKGTATFSDLANEIAAEYEFWLGDAFASGGSRGYDHKRMGITARGAWVSVEAHLREIAFDTDRDPFTVAGIGDLSGDVFGNGMLLSERIRLIAAFDHRHIFLDPNPDPLASYMERRRVFDLPSSDWTSYETALISPGGGVYPRNARQIPLSPEVRERLGIVSDSTSLTPDEFVRAILSAPVTLLWNGGVGTYVKSSDETHAEVRDKANDAVRVDAAELRCRVVGEGGNLGLTQRARIEYARRGGRVNADFVDNSAGVDTSDHEVNLKVLIDAAPAVGERDSAARDSLLASMQPAVAHAVLQDNRRQSLAITLAVHQGPLVLDRHARLLTLLEKDAGLVRRLEFLPDEDELARRRATGEGLSRPEVATLLAWSKISVREALLASDLPSDPAVRAMLGSYFPAEVRRPEQIDRHPLAREIAGTVLANDIVNQAGPGFFCRLEERTGALLPDAAAAFAVTREILGLGQLWAEVEEQDSVATVARLDAFSLIQRALEDASGWLLRRRPSPLAIEDEIRALAEPVARARSGLATAMDPDTLARLDRQAEHFAMHGLPAPLAREVAESALACTLLDISEVAAAIPASVEEVAEVFRQVDHALGFEWLRASVVIAGSDPHWLQLAKASLVDDLGAQVRTIAHGVLDSTASAMPPPERVAHWLKARAEPVRRHCAVLAELRSAPEVDLARLTVAAQQGRDLAASAAGWLAQSSSDRPGDSVLA